MFILRSQRLAEEFDVLGCMDVGVMLCWGKFAADGSMGERDERRFEDVFLKV